jgi:hypothetical protein
MVNSMTAFVAPSSSMLSTHKLIVGSSGGAATVTAVADAEIPCVGGEYFHVEMVG